MILRKKTAVKNEKTKGRADLTEGSIYVQLTLLSVPLIFGNILQQLYNTIDAVIIGRFAGADEFAAVGVAGSIMNLFIFITAGLCDGFAILLAKKNGAADMNGFRRQHFTAFVEGLAFAAALGAAGALAMNIIVDAVNTPGDIAHFVCSYMRIVMLSLPMTFLYNFYAAMLRSVGDTRAALVILAAAVALNLALDILFVAAMGYGINGAAAATALTQGASAVMCAAYVVLRYGELMFRRRDSAVSADMLKNTARFGAVSALHHSGLYIGKLLVQGAVNTAGKDVIAAYTAATRIEGFANSFGDSGAAASSAMIANNCGAGKKERVNKIYRAALLMLLCLGAACALVMYVGAEPAVACMLGGEASGAALASGASYLRIVSLFYIFCFAGNALAGYFNGTGHVIITFAGALGHISIRVIISWLTIGSFGLPAVAVATGIGWVCVNIFWGELKRDRS